MHLTNKLMSEYRTKINRLSGNQCLLHDNGIFEIHNVSSKSDADRIVSLLKREYFIADARALPDRYNFGKFDFSKGMAEPERYFTIRGIVKDVDLNETIEIHATLNPKIWDDENELLPDVRAKILQIVDKFKSLLALDKVDLKIEDIYILGSNANFNYNEDSDLDVHIIADESFDCSKEHLAIIYNCYKALFNNKYDIRIKGINVELYVENKDKLSNVSTGVYSFEKGWIKNPTKYKRPEIDQLAVDKGVQLWENKYYDIMQDPSIKKVDDYIDDIYKLRVDSIQKDGEFGVGNLIFKEIRRLGYLDDLKDVKVKLTSKELSLEGLEEVLDESSWKNLYIYEGPVYVDGHLRTPQYTAETMAPSAKKALSNIQWKARNAFASNRVELVPEYLYLEEDEEEEKPVHVELHCPKCGRLLTTSGECPLCDLGDESVLDEDLIVCEPEEGKDKLGLLKHLIENEEVPDVKSCLLTLMDIYLFQTYKPSDRENSTLTDDEWQEYADFCKAEKEKGKKESLNEGCWGMPHTLAEVNKLKELMSKPVDAFEVGDVPESKNKDLGIGDDTLFDNIAKYRKEHGYGTEASNDVRKVIQDFIKNEVLPNWDDFRYSDPEGNHDGEKWEEGVKEVFQEIADMDLSAETSLDEGYRQGLWEKALPAIDADLSANIKGRYPNYIEVADASKLTLEQALDKVLQNVYKNSDDALYNALAARGLKGTHLNWTGKAISNDRPWTMLLDYIFYELMNSK